MFNARHGGLELMTPGREGVYGGYIVIRGDILRDMDVSGVEVVGYQPEAFEALARLRPFRFMLFIIGRELRAIGRHAPEKFRDAFTFCRLGCYRAVPDYDRRNMCVLDETGNWSEEFPFPDMRGCEGRAAVRAIDLMRRVCEYAPARTVVLCCFGVSKRVSAVAVGRTPSETAFPLRCRDMLS
jgi:hypothetical protein